MMSFFPTLPIVMAQRGFNVQLKEFDFRDASERCADVFAALHLPSATVRIIKTENA